MNMMNNPLMMLMGLMHSGGNPMMILQQMAVKDPQVAQFMRMLNGKNTQQLQQMAEMWQRKKASPSTMWPGSSDSIFRATDNLTPFSFRRYLEQKPHPKRRVRAAR